MNLTTVLTMVSGISFLFFGTACLFTTEMKSEFRRYGFEKSRKVVGILQLLGALGLLLGYLHAPLLQTMAAAGLSILMFLGFLVRLRLRDSFLQSAPSLFYALLNGVLFMLLLGRC